MVLAVGNGSWLYTLGGECDDINREKLGDPGQLGFKSFVPC